MPQDAPVLCSHRTPAGLARAFTSRTWQHAVQGPQRRPGTSVCDIREVYPWLTRLSGSGGRKHAAHGHVPEKGSLAAALMLVVVSCLARELYRVPRRSLT